MSVYNKYQAVIGLEIHAQLSTKSKAYASDSATFGDLPNTNISPVTLGHPGTLPVLNEKNIEFAVKLGLAVGATIRENNEFARKNYFYADLPKGYQITQDKTPICTGGFITLFPNTAKEKKIEITRIHMEEDAGKSIHDQDPFNTLVDLNRAGVPLVEIVSEPQISSAEEAYEYVTQVRKLLRYLEICDGNMEEGSLRCDANVSVMLKGASKFGERTETKNMNSIRNVKRAIEHEIIRQIDVLENGGKIEMETRSFNAVDGTTFTMRSKEEAHDYRYFPEPDLQPVIVSQNYINDVKTTLPTLPNELYKVYTKEFGLSEYDANLIIESKPLGIYYNELTQYTKNYKAASNWLNGSIKSYLNENGITIENFVIKPAKIAALIQLIDDGKVSNTVASQHIFPIMVKQPELEPLAIAEQNNLIQESNDDDLSSYIEQVIENNPKEIERFRNGEQQLIGFLMGQLMKTSKGKADPKKANSLLREKLKQ
ncbi:MAG: Asp-tRNA(Asn)/Glu-tRNA(Gln) amidotransferase subunit GatB [Vicingaceae bacterium]|nr:Asp-tRNA(Asn)/Glu-tRNA(Gln) amidotransferase subunit GatB [Flavobacteriales bacterium]MDF1676294.1 Asp-tRNA(Asn)/Glu-tRNA(Gln) amidotransferase subunit GatB [Vicingaceae bacterium]